MCVCVCDAVSVWVMRLCLFSLGSLSVSSVCTYACA